MAWIEKGILRGIDRIIFDHLEGKKIGEPPHYDRPSFCGSLKKSSLSNLDATDLIRKIHDRIVDNLSRSDHAPSTQNWRWDPKLNIGKENKSSEVRLEKAIVNINPKIWAEVSEWSNQVPTSSGLLGRYSDRKRAIDLVHRMRNGGQVDYEFIELKVGSNNPLSAAMEVLVYGMLYVVSRKNRTEMGYVCQQNPLMWGRDIGLRVLAPLAYYDGCHLAGFEKKIDGALASFVNGRGFGMGFEFQAFPKKFQPSLVLKEPSSRDQQIAEAMCHRAPVYHKIVR